MFPRLYFVAFLVTIPILILGAPANIEDAIHEHRDTLLGQGNDGEFPEIPLLHPYVNNPFKNENYHFRLKDIIESHFKRKRRELDEEELPFLEADEEQETYNIDGLSKDSNPILSTFQISVVDPTKGSETKTIQLNLDSYKADNTDSLLVVRKGGSAIAGPGGFATAYTGGVATVGPYGTIFKSPGGIAIGGPYSRIINITDSTPLEDMIKYYIQAKKKKNHWDLPPVAVEFKSVDDLFTYKARNDAKVWKGEMRSASSGTQLKLSPVARAEAGQGGMAISIPMSRAVVLPENSGPLDIKFEPQASASVGADGFAHAHSDLHVIGTDFPPKT